MSENHTKIYITSTSRSRVIREGSGDWDRDDTDTSHSVEQLSVIGSQYSEYCYYPGSINKGDRLYLVYAVWSTGDSFGRDYGKQIDFISVHKSKENADKNRDILEHRPDEDDDKWESTIYLDDGTEYRYHKGWVGYFESLDYISVEEFYI